MTGRSVPEWIGKTPDTPVPPRVKARVFLAHDGICHLSGRKIRAGEPWECDHVKAIINDGENRESNLAPALKDKHREKTNEDVDEKSRINRIRLKHLGQWPKGPKINSPGFRDSRKAKAARAADGQAWPGMPSNPPPKAPQ